MVCSAAGIIGMGSPGGYNWLSVANSVIVVVVRSVSCSCFAAHHPTMRFVAHHCHHFF